HDVRRKLEFEAEHEPGGEPHPHVLLITYPDRAREPDRHEADQRLDRADHHDDRGADLDRQCDIAGERLERLLHQGASSRRVSRPAATPGPPARTMQRKPRWQVALSIGWAMRAAGR